MMNYSNFMNEMKAAAEGRGYTAEIRDVMKANSHYKGLVLHKDAGTAGVTVNLRDHYRRYQDGEGFSCLAEEIFSGIGETLAAAPDINILRNLDIQPENLMAEAVNTERNRDYLAHVPHVEICDLSVIVRARVPIGDGRGEGSVVFTDDLLRLQGVQGSLDLPSILCSIERAHPCQVSPMSDVLAGLCGQAPSGNMPVLVATTEEGMRGAGILGYPGFLRDCGERYGSFYLLPSSIHELLLYPSDDGGEGMEGLYGMVCDINATVVTETDFLSDNAYYFDAGEGILTDYFGRTYQAG